MRILDLFCGAGGAAMGLHQAFPDADIIGVDIAPQKRYPFKFYQSEVFEWAVFEWRDFDFIWASPPCQAHVSLRWMHNAKQHESLIGPVRRKLIELGRPYVIENVPSAPLMNPLLLCGSMFGLGTKTAELRRHRHFEASFDTYILKPMQCRHGLRDRVIGVYGGHGRDRRRKVLAVDFPMADRREAMGIDWMTTTELSQAIPPAYSRYIGEQFKLSQARVA
jgi:DNA (cytosine-5)-methyltransferase 1